MVLGYFTFVLHTHLPYVRLAGRWPHGEEMIHQAIAETYIPLLNALNDLKAEGYHPRLTLGLTPILMEQLADADVRQHFEVYVEERLGLLAADLERFEGSGEEHLAYLARYYSDWYGRTLDAFRRRYQRDLVGAFRQLQREGVLEVITSAATHGYLPLMARDSTIYGQLQVGVSSYWQRLDMAPRGIWLPEAGYRPPFNEGDRYRPGTEEFLADLNLHYFFADTHAIEGGRMVGKLVGDVVGPYGGIPERELVLTPDERPQAQERSTLRPYYVRAAKVAVFGRNERTGVQVWSASEGYPGDFVYREFHRKDVSSGMQYWRITSNTAGLDEKALYDPIPAFQRARDHAGHFVHLVREELRAHAAHSRVPGIVVSAYDTELFGHWWFEGVAWLQQTLRLLEDDAEIGLTTADRYLAEYPPDEVVDLPESSWGKGGGHWTWLNPETEWMWPLVHNAERRMEQLVALYPQATGEMARVLAQTARELVLLQASDWPFLVSTGQATEYAIGRFQRHLARFNVLSGLAERGEPLKPTDLEFLANAEVEDNPFPDIDYRAFRERRYARDS
ncbi:MAG: glycoside hydrolase family 57 protein [Anaerolineae bacterium]